ncbi:MAG: 50S ribosomal protein L11 methyltransferase [Alphaproteobacteria bacterium]|nr:50S ribosomal protein L11 methyltransferase [Alphaproteobacteria bacterium]
MFSARIKLPAHLSQSDINVFADMLGDTEHAFTGLRADNHDKSPWTLEWITENKPAAEDMSARVCLLAELNEIDLTIAANDWQIEKLPEIDWLAHSYQQFPPFSVGPFFIYGSHYEGAVPPEQMGLQIDAATAFGSGEHGTTKGCLQAMLELKHQGICPWQILDMGTGSGILAIAAWKLWKTPVLAVDNDEEAVRVTERHREANKVPAGAGDLTSAHGDGFASTITQEKKPYELVIANILAGPLKDMAADLKDVVDENGYVILSGILNEQAEDVLSAYQAQGLTLRKTYKIGEWTTLVLHNPAA